MSVSQNRVSDAFVSLLCVAGLSFHFLFRFKFLWFYVGGRTHLPMASSVIEQARVDVPVTQLTK